MKEDLKKRLERALKILQEPRGSTVQSIVRIINSESPTLNLRKILEALQEGLNEGFLCMYNSRFKLAQQTQQSQKNDRELEEENFREEKRKKKRASDSDFFDDESDVESDDDEAYFENESPVKVINKNRSDRSFGPDSKPSRHSFTKGKPFRSKNKQRFSSSGPQKQHSKAKRKKYQKEPKSTEENDACSSFELTSKKKPDQKSSRSTMKIDLKKQRGPRCTSMKKDVRMPSKVHIPYIPAKVPPKINTYNDLLRRSPETVNGPLFDNLILNEN